MHADEYQRLAARTLIDKPDFVLSDDESMIIWNALGLAGEAGEVAELVKKGLLHRHGLDSARVANELGDVLWYVAALCTRLGLNLSQIMAGNIEKLEQRYPEGYSSERSINRKD